MHTSWWGLVESRNKRGCFVIAGGGHDVRNTAKKQRMNTPKNATGTLVLQLNLSGRFVYMAARCYIEPQISQTNGCYGYSQWVPTACSTLDRALSIRCLILSAQILL